MTPKQLANRVIARLRAARNPARAASSRRFFKQTDDVAFYGLTVPDTRKIEREAFSETRGQWHLTHALQFADQMIKTRQIEAKLVGLLTLKRFQRHFKPSVLGTAERWLRADYCNNWAIVDALCPYVIAPLVAAYPDLIPRVLAWTRARSLWLRRASAVTFVPLARRGRCLQPTYQVATALLDDPEDLIHKATGWLLREAGRTDRKKLERFLLRHRTRIPRTTVRYAIEHFPETKRKRFLTRTAGQANDKRERRRDAPVRSFG